MSQARIDAAARRIQGAWRIHQARKIAAKNKADLTKRKHASMEILTTEESYCRTLDLIVDRFLVPTRDTKVLSKKNTVVIFANIEDIRQINSDMLVQLRHAMAGWTNQTKVGPVLAKLVHSLRLYKTYCSNYNTGLTRLEEKRVNNPKFSAFLERTMAEIGVNMPLQAYLIQPVQRIPRYRLLFAELLKHTPETHVDFEGIRQSLDSVAEIAILVNESIREAEYMNSLVELKKKFSSDVPDLIKPRKASGQGGPLDEGVPQGAQAPPVLPAQRPADLRDVVDRSDDERAQFRFHRALPLQFTSVVDIPDRNNAKHAFQFLSKAKSVRGARRDRRGEGTVDRRLHQGLVGAGSGAAARSGARSGRGHRARLGPDRDSKVCMLCQVKFTTLNRRHHCRNCGTLCCGVCSAHKTFLPNINKTCRVCYACFETITGRPAAGKAKAPLPRQTSLAATRPATSTLHDELSDHHTDRAPALPTNLSPPLDTDDDEYSSGSEFIDSDDELWEPPSKPAPPVPSF